MGFRNYADPEEDQQPMMWVAGRGLYAAHVIVVVFVLSMIATTIALATRATGVLQLLTFQSARVLELGEVWRLLSYGFINPPSLWFAIDMVMIVWFGRELEKSFGRRTFLTFYGLMYLLSPLLLTVIGLWRPTTLQGQAGSFGLFIAFATLYPNVSLFFNLLVKWVAWVLVGIYSLMHLAAQDFTGLVTLWATTGFAYGFVQYQKGVFSLPDLRFWRRKPNLRVLPGGRQDEPPRPKPDASATELDELLDKIAKSGIGSLTPQERAKLEARASALQKRRGGPR